jgi:hypothetical protein
MSKTLSELIGEPGSYRRKQAMSSGLKFGIGAGLLAIAGLIALGVSNNRERERLKQQLEEARRTGH